MIRTVTLEKLLFYRYFVDDVINRVKKNRHGIIFQHLNNYPKMNLTIKENPSNFLETKIIKYNLNLTTKGPNYPCVGHLEFRNSATEMSCLETFTDQRKYQVTLKWSIAFSRMAIHYSFHLICLMKVNYHYCTTSFNKAWSQTVRRFKYFWRWCIGGLRRWESLSSKPFIGQPFHSNTSSSSTTSETILWGKRNYQLPLESWN